MTRLVLLALLATENPDDALDRVLESPGERWTVERAIRAGTDTSPQVAAARAALLEAAANRQTAWADVLPRVNLTAQYTRLSEIDNDPLVNVDFDIEAANAGLAQVSDPAARALLDAQITALEDASSIVIDVPQNRYTLSAQVSYPLSQLFLEILPAIRAQGDAEAATEFEVAATQNAVALAVVQLYFDHARARSALAVSELSVRRAADNLARAEARLRNALGNRPDVLRFQARLAEAESERAERAASVESTANALRTLLHIDGEGPLAFQESLTALPLLDGELLATSLDQAFATRDELRALVLITEATEHQASAVKGGMWPTLSVAAGVDYANPNEFFVPPIDEFRTSFTVSGVLSWSPDRAWATSRRGSAADAQVLSAREREAALRDTIRTEVVDAKARYRSSFEIYAAAVRQSAAAEEAYAARKKGYEVGLFDATSLIDSELDARRARLALIDAGANVRVRRFSLARSVGVHLWEG